jgi:hypothetical protein
MKLLSIKPSTRATKKYMATFLEDNGKQTIRHFGSMGMSDYTIHKDAERKMRYLLRHKANEHWEDPKTAGALSKWILWNKPTLSASVEDYKKHFNL